MKTGRQTVVTTGIQAVTGKLRVMVTTEGKVIGNKPVVARYGYREAGTGKEAEIEDITEVAEINS